MSTESHEQATGETAPEWFQYQERVAEFFRALGVQARTNVRVQGARGTHDVDVLVEFESAGIAVTWVVECKAWSRPVGKDRVLVLAGVVGDIGADRGLIVSEAGYQAGAIRAAERTNLTLTSLADLSENTAAERQRVERGGVAAHIYRLTTAVSEAWRWAPPSTPADGLDLGHMVDFAADVFDLNSLILPKLMNDTFPIVINTPAGERDVARDPAEARTKTLARLEAAEAEAVALTMQVESARGRAAIMIDTLEATIDEMLASGRALGDVIHADEHRLRRFVAAMGSVGSQMDAVVPVVPAEVRDELRATRRWLIDDIYVVADQVAPDWDFAQIELASRMSRIRGRLAARSRQTSPADGSAG